MGSTVFDSPSWRRIVSLAVVWGVLLWLLPFRGMADEGMWLLPLLKEQNLAAMQRAGLQIDIDSVYNADGVSLKDGVVLFGGGCTGELISSEGLVLTNHHCGYAYIQQHSSVENDLLTNGFWAMSREEELPNPGLTVTFTERMEDVTAYVKEALEKDTTGDETLYLSAKFLNALAREYVGGEAYLNSHPGTKVEIKPLYGGNVYYLYVQKVYSDVRLVGAPPSSIGKFGADTDNWMWPRHTGDFSLFRIYADRQGNPAKYSPDNVPLRPRKHFTLSLKGIAENDFVMLMGFPGRTNHFYTPAEVIERRDIENSIRVEVRDVWQQIMLKEMLSDPQVRIQYARKYASSTNSYKSSKGMNKMIEMQQLEALKRRQCDSVLQWASANGRADVAQAVALIDSLTAKQAPWKRRQSYLREALQTGIEFSGVRYDYAKLDSALQKGNKDSIRAELPALEKAYRAFADKDYSAAVDKKIAKAMWRLYLERIAEKERPEWLQKMTRKYKDTDAYIDHIFDRSIFGSAQNLESFLKSPSRSKLAEDPMFLFARAVAEEQKAVTGVLDRYVKTLQQAQRTYIEAIQEMSAGRPIYPDANLTLRLSYGNVKGLEPADGIAYLYYTTLDGVMEKEDADNWEFVVPDRLKEAYRQKAFGVYARPDGKMPVCFIANTHTTGGNSGSPILNARGELVGTGFDRNWEGISGDIQYNPAFQRTICVDIRYTLFIIDRIAGAGHLLKEMDIVY